MTRNFTYGLATILLVLSYPTDSVARAFCALRDPLHAMNDLFPEADNHRSIVRSIGSDVRDRVAKELPFTLHFNELGKHTLYVATRAAKPVGFAHVRSELAGWGLMEIAWALNPDLSVRSLVFQRCRSPACRGEFLAKLQSELGGKSASELRALIAANGDSLLPDVEARFPGNEALALAAIRSALKTITVTSIAWESEVAEANREILLDERYTDGAGYTLNREIVNATTLAEINAELGSTETMIERNSIELFGIDGTEGRVGWIVSSRWHERGLSGTSHWLFDNNGTVASIRTIPQWPDQEIAQSFGELAGKNFADGESCFGAAELIGHELYLLTRNGGNRK